MFYINYRFGHNKIFENYIGEKELIVPGEIQHGYWRTDKWRSRIGRYPFLKTFLWGGSFTDRLNWRENQSIIKIGDPFLYHLNLNPIRHKANNFTWLLIPKLSPSYNNLESSLNYHSEFLIRAKSEGVPIAQVTLHPSEIFLGHISKFYESQGLSVVNYGEINPTDFYRIMIETYTSHLGLITNYIGPHIFRSEILNLQMIFIINNFETTFQKNDNDSTALLALKSLNSDARADFSRKELGFDFMRKPDEIKALFYQNQKTLKSIYAFKTGLTRSRNFLQNATDEIIFNQTSNLHYCKHCYTAVQFQKGDLSKRCKCGFKLKLIYR